MPKLPIYSKRAKADPSLTNRIRNEYEKTLVRKFRDVLPRILDLLSSSKKQLSGLKQLQYGDYTFDIKRFDDQLGLLIEVGILSPSGREAKRYIEQLVHAGMVRADDFMEALGFTAMIGGMPLDPRALEILQSRNLSALKGITDEMEKKIIDELSDGMLKGEGADDLQRRIRNSVEDIGINRARVMARTESMYAFNTAAKERYARNGIKQVQWLTAYENVCSSCEALSEKIFDISEAPDCPLHPNCACTLLPVIEEYRKEEEGEEVAVSE